MKKKKVLITLSIVGIFILSIIIYNYLNPDRIVIASGKSEEYVNDRTFSLMLETSAGSGEYQMSSETTWPNSDYEYNGTLSSCENGSQLIWNEDTRTVTLKANISDKCYLYFDYNPKPTVTLATNNTDNTFNLSTPATLSCSNATATYNQKYQRVEISQISAKPSNCTLTYQEPSSKIYLNNYIIGLEGMTQGIGKVVNEINVVANYTNATILNQSDYNNVTMYSTSSSSSSETINTDSYVFSGNSWSTVMENMEVGYQYDYHLKFNLSSNGYYQLCYTVESIDNSAISAGDFAVFNGTLRMGSNYGRDDESACIDLGYVDTGTDIRIVRAATKYSTGERPNVTFNLQRASSTRNIDTGYRYEGKDPNNYIWFNNELWRIIGVFDESSHGQSGQNLVKIIRSDSIGGLAWHKSKTNDWTASSLMNLLNGAYYNSQNGTGGEYCYGSTSTPANCDYTESGINDKYRSMIKNVTWYLGGHNNRTLSANGRGVTFYMAERGTNVYSGRPTTTTGYIGLMYPSDYGYSVLESSCARTINLESYYSSTCAGQSWLYGQGYEWTITPYSDPSNSSNAFSTNVFTVYYNGVIRSSETNIGYAARPVLYLDSNVYVINGTGTQSDPYIIGM